MLEIEGLEVCDDKTLVPHILGPHGVGARQCEISDGRRTDGLRSG